MKKMLKFKNNKLWRDKLPGRMESKGSIIHVKQLNDEEFDAELRIKLMEEADEVKSAQSKKEILAELADVYEVIDSLKELHGISSEDIIAEQTKKREERGGFKNRQYVTIAEHLEGSFGAEYCLADPKKYPEVLK